MSCPEKANVFKGRTGDSPVQLACERARAKVLAAIDQAEAELAQGEGIDITKECMRQFVDDIKKRGRERLAARQTVLN